VFAEPHITDYRIKRFQCEPIVRTAENLSYTLLASDQLENPTLNSLVGKSIVTMPSPSLGFAMLLDFYPNPVSQPNILSSAASWRDGVEIVFAGEADAAIVPTWLKDQYPNLIPIQTSREFPGAAITACASLDPAAKQALGRTDEAHPALESQDQTALDFRTLAPSPLVPKQEASPAPPHRADPCDSPAPASPRAPPRSGARARARCPIRPASW
jgi:hypothetical protein